MNVTLLARGTAVAERVSNTPFAWDGTGATSLQNGTYAYAQTGFRAGWKRWRAPLDLFPPLAFSSAATVGVPISGQLATRVDAELSGSVPFLLPHSVLRGTVKGVAADRDVSAPLPRGGFPGEPAPFGALAALDYLQPLAVLDVPILGLFLTGIAAGAHVETVVTADASGIQTPVALYVGAEISLRLGATVPSIPDFPVGVGIAWELQPGEPTLLTGGRPYFFLSLASQP